MKKRAILFAGGVDIAHNHIRYENDLRLAYTVLVEKLHYKNEDISIFLGYGKPMMYNGVKIPTTVVYKKLFIEKFNAIADELEEEDCLVFIVSNHGDQVPCINMWGSEYLEFDEFEILFKKIKARKLIIMGQCYCGNFLKLDIENTCLITANKPNRVTYGRYPDNKYDEFLYLFFSFLYGKYPDTFCKINEAELDIDKAFEFAFKNDQFNPCGDCFDQDGIFKIQNAIESPTMKNNISDLSIFVR